MSARLKRGVSAQDHIRGDGDAPLTIVEYGDYQCPFCGRFYWIVKHLMARLNGKLRFVFRNFPLNETHPMARASAIAAEAAALQGKFWEMHDALYENQNDLSEQRLIELAEGIGLDISRFEEDWQDRESLAERVQQDFMTGVRSGVSGTPGIYINGEKYEGPLDEESLMEELSSRLGPNVAA